MPTPPPIQPPDPLPLKGRVVLITGGAQGIGRGIAQGVLGAGGSVLIGDADVEAGEACLAEWNVGEAARFRELDVSKETSVRRFVEHGTKTFGRVDGLVNNAAIADPDAGPLESLSLADWNRYMAVNLTSVLLCCRQALPSLRECGGSVVNLASTRALMSEADTEPYATAKGGIVAFTHALAMSAGPEVRVNVISPGWVPTEQWQKPGDRKPPKLTRKDHAQHPAGRAGTPMDIAHLAVYLLSEQSAFVTGQNFVIDGGMVRKMVYA
ncbi:SDR family oxidoreductase [Cognatilysobacter bugurensis]|uniref:Oxidoreductase n=1 Tax=Cognatilysobacter bugurensis TaxID=543356 RepID=A0A918SYS0_9GAMM|nr:SDR family oxidoreductase [Lysobacter bugurensis]GHA73858.1 oxidoreductase [Lysobacter bugurensis]